MIIPKARVLQMRRRAPYMQEHTHNHAQRRGRQEHHRHLPRHDLHQTWLAATRSRIPILGKQVANVFEPVAVR